MSGPIEIRLRAGLSPTSPQHAAGIRIEPPPSSALATGTMPAATAAADPPDEPPGVRSEVPRVVGGPEPGGLGDGHDPGLGHVRPADDDHPRVLQAPDLEGVVVGRVVAEQPRPEGQGRALHRHLGLDRHRHAGERPRVAGLDRIGGGQRLFGVHVGEGVDVAVEVQETFKEVANCRRAGIMIDPLMLADDYYLVEIPQKT